MIRKLASGKYRLYSRKKNPKTGRRRNLGTFASRAAAAKHERAVQFSSGVKRGVSRMRCSVQRCTADPGPSQSPYRRAPTLRRSRGLQRTNNSASTRVNTLLRAALRPGHTKS